MIQGAGNHELNLASFKTQIRDLMENICDAVSMVNFRLEPHPDAREFNRDQLIYLLAGGTQVAANSDSIKPFVENLLVASNPSETHIALLHAKDIGCDNPQANVSALELHGGEECNNCVGQRNIILEDSINPFPCWRRGHRSGNIGFVLNMNLVFLEYKNWFFENDSITVSASRPMIPYFSNYTPVALAKPCGQMVAIIRIKPPGTNTKTGTNLSEIQQLLSQQLLISKSPIPIESSHTDVNFKEVPNLLVEMLNDIQVSWKRSSHYSDTFAKHLGLLLINYDGDEIINEIKPALQNFHSRQVAVHEVKSSSFSSQLFHDLDISKGNISKGDVLVVLSLDPIIDLGVKPLGNRK